jgi:hypothetical protein
MDDVPPSQIKPLCEPDFPQKSNSVRDFAYRLTRLYLLSTKRLHYKGLGIPLVARGLLAWVQLAADPEG